MLYSVVVPVYRSVESLRPLCQGIVTQLSQIVEQPGEFEIILVDDSGKGFRSWQEIVTICDTMPQVRGLRLSKNRGQQIATLAGMSSASGKWIITMDDDLQHDPGDLSKMLSYKQHDVVVGLLQNKKHSWFKRLTSRIKGKFDHIVLGKPKDMQLSSFRVFKRYVVDAMLQTATLAPFIPALFFSVSDDVVNVPVSHHPRNYGQTGYSFRKMVQLFSNLIINNSSLLLKGVGFLGLSMSLLSLGFACYVLLRSLAGTVSAPGWSSVMIMILLLGGVTLFSIGITGEYLIRIISVVERRQMWVEKDRT